VISDAELEKISPKSKKDPAIIDLYRAHEYMTAYALHTDRRVEQDGPKAAVGNPADWERHGELQAEFLKRMGLGRRHTLLEIGCGTGRLARKIIPYLDAGGYYGVDISPLAVKAANDTLLAEGLTAFGIGTYWPAGCFDYLWAFSVTIHLPADELRSMMQRAARRMHPASRFLFSYVPEQRDERTGLKQFRHTLATYREAALTAGLSFRKVEEWKGEQSVALAELL
jgi:SAM-dependent methyltransferase